MTLALPLRLDDADAMAVLADWLAERGDVRGALCLTCDARVAAAVERALWG